MIVFPCVVLCSVPCDCVVCGCYRCDFIGFPAQPTGPYERSGNEGHSEVRYNGFKTGFQRREEQLSGAIMIDGRREWFNKTRNETNVWMRGIRVG